VIARGERKFIKTCVRVTADPRRDGPVAALFMPPPDLLAEPTRQRARRLHLLVHPHGGVVMLPTARQVTAEEAWLLVTTSGTCSR